MATTSTTKSAGAKSAKGTTKKAPAKKTAKKPELALHEEFYYATLGLYDWTKAEFWNWEKDLVLRGQKVNKDLSKKAKKLRKDAEKQVKEVRENVEEEYQKVLEKVGLSETA